MSEQRKSDATPGAGEGQYQQSNRNLTSTVNSSEFRNYRSDALERLYVKNDNFKENLNIIAFTKPSVYFNIKKRYMEYILQDIIKKLHDTVYFALTTGKKEDGTYIIDIGSFGGIDGVAGSQFEPNIPAERADQIAMNICLTLKDAIQDDVIDAVFTSPQIERAFNTVARRAENEIVAEG